jgi:Protein of unknown function (DUF2939)
MKKWLIALVVLVAAYMAYPYFTLWRIESAMARRDAVTLDALVDWARLRTDMKTQIRAHALERIGTSFANPPPGPPGFGPMPPMGPMAATMGAAFVVPMVESLVDVVASSPGLFKVADFFGLDLTKGRERVSYAFFVSPSEFRVDTRGPDPASPATMTMVLSLDGPTWKVTGVKLPIEASEQLLKNPAALR